MNKHPYVEPVACGLLKMIFNNKLWFLTPLKGTYNFGFCIGRSILIRRRGCQKETRDTSFSSNLFSGLGRIPSLVTSFPHTLVAMQSLVRDLLCLLLNQVSFKDPMFFGLSPKQGGVGWGGGGDGRES